MPVTLVFKRQRQEDYHDFEASLDYKGEFRASVSYIATLSQKAKAKTS